MHKTFLLSLFIALTLPLQAAEPLCGADQVEAWLPFTRNKKVALVVNQTSRVGQTHLVDSMLSLGVQIQGIFAPEHGFRGDHGAGEKVKSSKDVQTGLPIISLYGKHKKPTKADLAGVDLVIFDIQDVGARFYTYISTMHYVMEACAEQAIPFLVLDRPNPNGFYVDGPVLDTNFKSFVGMHPIPVVHGMTIGEYAQMINGEGWLNGGIQCNLAVVQVKHYKHTDRYSLPVAPSPNLPNDLAIAWYPSLCFFEGTPISLGRGTNKPFQLIGHPNWKGKVWVDTVFVPVPIAHAAPNPPLKGDTCFGKVFNAPPDEEGMLHLEYLFQTYDSTNKAYFTSFFALLAGGKSMANAIESGMSYEDYRATWTDDLDRFKAIRKKYLLYPDFE
ncbi:MAG: DUF1343 domain-containing protein [Bacteroidetes bacterium]|nr:MAG: DUF1343 domain-containing protein [Bacteroidota bacterium]